MLAGKVALVVGGAANIGRVVVESLIEEKVKVCIGDINENEGKALADALNKSSKEKIATFQKCDVKKAEDIESLFQLTKSTFGRMPDIAVNIAGILHEFDWALCVDVNVGGNMRCTDAVVKHMSKENGGSGGVFVAMASIAGLQPEWWLPVYCTTKHAIVGLCRTMGRPQNLEIHGVRFNCVCPTAVETSFTNQIARSRMGGVWPAEREAHKQQGMRLTPSIVAKAFMKAIKEENLNGEAIRVSDELGIDVAPFTVHPAQ